MRPVLFLDVDGPLIPFGAPPAAGRTRPAAHGNPLLARLDPRHGTWLAALPCDLVWATTWMADANSVIAPLLGLPALPVVDFPDDDPPGAVDQPASGVHRPASGVHRSASGVHWSARAVHWKTRGLVAWAAGRPFVWVDDEIGAADRDWVATHLATHRGGPALLHAVDAGRGLTREDVDVIAAWLNGLG